MSNEDEVIAKALNAGLRRLLVAAFIHEKETVSGHTQLPGLQDAFSREIARLVMRGTTENGEDVELTAAVRKGLKLFVEAAYREASEGRTPPAKMQ
jgi:hypothetical protein